MSTTTNPQNATAPAATDNPPSGNPRIVKRYSNRKLYDTVESRYVTLPQIAELVRQGEDVRIIDNNTKEDLTRMTLAQILYEEERKQSRALDLTALKDLLHSSSERIMSSLRETPVGKLITRTDGTERPAEEAPPGEEAPPPEAPVQAAPPSVPPTEGATRESTGRMQQFIEESREAIDQWQHRVDDRMKNFWEGINPAAQIQALQAEVKRLQTRVDALEARLGTSPEAAATSRPPAEAPEKE